MGSRLLALGAAMLLLAPPVLAQEPPTPEPGAPGTAASAAALQSALEAVVTARPFEQGLLRVEPDPAGERITIAPAAALSAWLGTPVRAEPFGYLVGRREDGNWNVFSRDTADLSVELGSAGQRQSYEFRQDALSFKGVFSPDLAAFLEGSTEVRGSTTVQSDAVARSSTRVDRTSLTTSARPGAGGGTDGEFRQTYRDYRQTYAVTLPQDGTGTGETAAMLAGFGFDVAAASAETQGQFRGARTRAVLDLATLLLRNASALSADPRQALAGPLGDDLREGLRRLLPVWASLDAASLARDVRLTSLYGELALAEAAQTIRMTGVAADAGFDLDMRVAGLRAQSSLLPAWSGPLLPEEIAFGLALSGADLATVADIALEEVDFGADPPFSPDAQHRLAEHFDADGLTLQLKPGRIRAKDFDLTFSGDVGFDDGRPAANATVALSGLDRTIATLQAAAADEPELHQAVGFLQIARGFGRPAGEDRFEWIVAAAADGSVTVNGATVKGPDPVADDGTSMPDTDEPPVNSQPSATPKTSDL